MPTKYKRHPPGDPSVNWVADWTLDEALALIFSWSEKHWLLEGEVVPSTVIWGCPNVKLTCEDDLYTGDKRYWLRDHEGLREISEVSFDSHWENRLNFAHVYFALCDDLVHVWISITPGPMSGFGSGYLIQRQEAGIQIINGLWGPISRG